jgi:hypothetical protein
MQGRLKLIDLQVAIVEVSVVPDHFAMCDHLSHPPAEALIEDLVPRQSVGHHTVACNAIYVSRKLKERAFDREKMHT